MIRAANQEEIPIVQQTMRDAFEEYRNRLNPPSGALTEEVGKIREKIAAGGAVIAWEGDKPVGSAQYIFREGYMYVGRVAVITGARGMGIGTKIMKYLEELAKEYSFGEIRLGVRLSIPQNYKFYLSLGYEVIERHEYPEKTDGWYIMSKKTELTEGSLLC
ncbi:GNAT family N-acetyltransferase [Paenibacillus sp. M1]|uniref:GNAT family N-acetyltransferase n=1 Tax=Paenibacillus haidiansis TaxID=1574488 RepID=A0ABU7VPW7_9BACL